MQKIITGSEVKILDNDFIKDNNISSFVLMERAAEAFCNWFIGQCEVKVTIAVFCGTGNNGGDGLAISRMLFSKGYDVKIFYIGNLMNASVDFKENQQILPKSLCLHQASKDRLASLKVDIIIDAVFGVGINRPLSGDYLEVIKLLNGYEAKKIAVDLPSGLPSDGILEGEAFISDHTVSFQFPKLSLLFPEHARYTGELTVLDIGITESYFDLFERQIYFIREKDLQQRHIRFDRFSHKGSFGKVMMVGGSYGRIGAIRMSSQAALRTGSGLVSCFLPKCGVSILQTALPEVMVESSSGELELKVEGLEGLERFDALGVGPGMGTSENAVECLQFILRNFQKPMVLDADALNILGANNHLCAFLRENILLTPHLKEFERLVGPCKDHVERIGKAKDFCKTHRCILILKGANSLISLPNGCQFFNSSGTQYMATGGAGDVLTGMLTSFLGQGYTAENAAICGVFHHGMAGELASEDRLRSTIATDIVESIPRTFVKLKIY